MVETWRPSEDHDRYGDDPAYLENAFCVAPLSELLEEPGVNGIARIAMLPSFSPESIYTLTYRGETVSVEGVHAEYSLWSSLNGGKWRTPTRSTIKLQLDDLPPPLDQWNEVREATKRAPSVSFAIIDGREYSSRDGVAFRHHLIDHELDLLARWRNPTELASNHVSQLFLIRAYNEIFQRFGAPVYDE